MPDVLGRAQVAAVNQASQAAITAGAVEIAARYLKKERWLAKRNRYRAGILGKIAEDASAGAANDRDMAQYLAASSVLHCADGWGYLGRAITAHLIADADTARHLGYYAELRATLGALATHGIGVFNGHHVVIKGSGEAKIFAGPPTHVMAWLSLPYWAQTHAASGSLARMIAPYQASFDSWARQLPAWQPVAERWLKDWGVDLQVLAKDRDARNESSYHPSRIDGKEALPVSDAVAFVLDLWQVLEPTSASDPFPELDLQLLRRGLEAAYRGTSKRVISPASLDWVAAVNSSIDGAVGRPSPPNLRRFLLRSDPDVAQDSQIFGHASAKRSIDDPRHHLSVISRALLLLRVCSGCVSEMCRSAGVDSERFAFWSSALAVDRGFVAAKGLPDPRTDLYADIGDAIHELRGALSSGALASYRDLHRGSPAAVIALGGADRVPLWGLAA